jgi:quercetin dioxygenase-like cupin family protein
MDGQSLVNEDVRLARRAQILALQEHMLGMDPAEHLCIEAMTSHIFAGGVYCRQMTIPKGTLVVGKIHKTEHLAILLTGTVQITTEEGTHVFEGPKIMVAPPGIKRVALALTDTIWLAIHAVGAERDLEIIERQFIAPSFEALEGDGGAVSIEGAG